MKSNFERMRENLLAGAGIVERRDWTKRLFTAADVAYIKIHKWSKQFEELMRTYLVMGSMRYESAHTALKCQWVGRPTKVQTATMIERLRKYEKDGNKEHLVDVANFCMIEFMTSDHPKTHFTGTDRL